MATRTAIRREIGLRTAQPWFQRYGKVAGVATGGGTTTLVDTAKILQDDNFWRGSYVYLVAADVVRYIDSSTLATWTLTWLEATTAVSADDVYEIWSQFSPLQVHDAINDTLRSAWPTFFTVEGGRVVLREGVGIDYPLSGLSPVPKWVARVQMETGGISSDTGVCDAAPGAQDRLKDTDKTFTAAMVGEEIRIYGGTSSGDIRTVSALIDVNTLQVSANFTTMLDDTSKYRRVDVLGATQTLEDVLYWSVNSYDRPTILRLGTHPSGWLGHVIRVVYEAEYPDLTAEDSECTAPSEWLAIATMARLFLMKLASAPASERSTWAALQRTYSEAADKIAAGSALQHVTTQLTDDQGAFGIPADYPFSY